MENIDFSSEEYKEDVVEEVTIRKTITNVPFKAKFEVKRILDRKENGSSCLEVKILKHEDYHGNQYEKILAYGNFACVFEGDVMSANVEYRLSTKGHYLKVIDNIKTIMPKVDKEIISFIRQRVSGIKKKGLEAALEIHGKDLIKTIIKTPDKLKGTPNLTNKNIEKMHDVLKNFQVYEKLLVFVQSIGLSPKVASDIFDELSFESLGKIKANPYVVTLSNEVDFATADKIAYQLNKKATDPKRIRCAIISYMEDLSNNSGDICSLKSDVVDGVIPYLQKFGAFPEDSCEKPLTKEDVHAELLYLIKNQKIQAEYSEEYGEVVYLRHLYEKERSVAIKMARFISSSDKSVDLSKKRIEDFISKKESSGLRFSDNQKKAIIMAITNKFSILSGGPGTGKTFVVKNIVECIKTLRPETTFRLMAPTGMASNRIEELTGMPASTIHRAIGMFGESSNGFGAEVKIEEDVVIVDESSMIDIFLFERLLSSLSDTSQLLLVGDYEQLPSIGPGLILKDLMNSNLFPVTILTEVFRQSSESHIISNSKKMLSGVGIKDKDGIFVSNKKGSDFALYEEDSAEKCVTRIVGAVCKYMDKVNDVNKICVLSPTKEGILGTIMLNRVLQDKLNPKRTGVKEFSRMDSTIIFREGDKVVNIKNDNELEVMNGYVGIISEIRLIGIDDAEIVVDFEKHDKIVTYSGDKISQLDLAYATTIHKSQGNEYPVVVVPIVMSAFHMMTKELLNTAWTRAQKTVLCVCIKGEDTIDKVAKEGKEIFRKSRLIERISFELGVN